jgi:hypothetical protein
MGATLRVQVATHIIKHEKDYKPMFSPDVSATTVEREDGDIPTCWSSWLSAIRRHKRWICGLTIKAAAARLGVQVIVVLRAKDGSWGNPMAIGEPKKKKKETPVILGLNEAQGHYTLLIPNSPTDVPASWLMAAQLDHFTSQNALRGAGSEAAGNWLPSATPSRDSSRDVRSRASSSRFWLPKATPSKSKAMSSAARTLPTKRPLPEEEANVDDAEEFFEPFVWTCGICQLQLTAHSRPALSKQRAAHVASRHKGHHKEAGELREKLEVVAASESLPVAERAWSCPYCNVGLPFLSKHLLALSKAAHMTKAHSKVAHRGAQIAKKMWKKWRKDPESVPSLKAGRFARSVTMKSKYLAKRDLSKCGHALVPVEIDWSVLPDSAASTRKKLTSSTCKHCWIVCRGGYKGHTQCRGPHAKLAASQVPTWLKMRNTVNAAPLLKAWGVSESQAVARFVAAATPVQKHEFDVVADNGHKWDSLFCVCSGLLSWHGQETQTQYQNLDLRSLSVFC